MKAACFKGESDLRAVVKIRSMNRNRLCDMLFVKAYSSSGTFLLKFSEKSFKKGIKFFLGTADIVSVRTKTLSARGARRIPGGRSSILGEQAAEANQLTKVTRKDSGDCIPS